MPPKKPTKAVKPATKSAAPKAAAFKPLPEATPRYVAPPPAQAVVAPVAAAPDDSWDLALRFWWAQAWRTMLVVLPLSLVLQVGVIVVNGGPLTNPLHEGFLMLVSLVLSVACQVAVVRHMLRKKTFKGFTFTLKGRE